MSNLHDFDKCWQEMEQKPIEFKVFGKVEQIPPSLPATLLLKIVRAQKEYGNNNLPENVQLELAISVFGEDKVEEWCKKGLTVDQLADMLKWAMEQYNPGGLKNGTTSS